MADAIGGAKLVGIAGVLAGEVFPLTGEEVAVGRDPANAVCVPDPSVSRHHCLLVRHGGAWEVRDLGSANSTFVNSVPVVSHAVSDGDRIGLGGSVLVFVAAASLEPRGVEMRASGAVRPTRQLASEATNYLQVGARDGTPPIQYGLWTLLALSEAINKAESEAALHARLLGGLLDCCRARLAAIVSGGGDGNYEVAAAEAPPGMVPIVDEDVVTQVIKGRVGLVTRAEGDLPWLLSAPLAAADTVLGALYLGRSEADGPFGEEELQLVTALGRLATPPLANLRRLAALQQDTERLQADLGVNFNLVGDSPAMRTAFARITRIAPSDVPVLVLGETGTGKELAARAVHANSRRARRPFVAINCAALAETLLESELFGHERGAFTGAVGQKRGKLEVADGGTLFLDEVGELTPAAQGKLLRVLQEHEFERVGGTRPIRIDIRLISATNRVLTDEVAAGRFRQDLYFRLSVVSVQMPPLRERKGDIALLARHFLARFGRATGRRVSGFSADAVQRLTAYSWPGNVRELENVVQRAAVLSAADEIGIDDLPEDVIQVPTGALGRDDDLDFHGAVIRTKKRVILAAFRKAGGSYVETARLLHVHPNYLHRLIRNLELKGELEDSRP